MKMKANLKKRWVNALRSGEYTQGSHALRTETSYCCLGVLCDILDPKEWSDSPIREIESNGGQDVYSYDDEWSYLPSSVVEDLHFEREDQDPLARMNDTGTTFDEIADWIEENISDE